MHSAELSLNIFPCPFMKSLPFFSKYEHAQPVILPSTKFRME